MQRAPETRPDAKRRLTLAILIGTATFALAAGSQAAKVELAPSYASTSCSAKLVLRDFGTCRDLVELEVTLLNGGSFVPIDDLGNVLTGRFKQRGKGGRELVVKLDRDSKRLFKRVLADAVADYVFKTSGALNF